MKIAFASGKGGTGKTTLAANVASVAARTAHSVAYLDCNVESPTGHLFLKPHLDHSAPVDILVPSVDESRCDHCGACGDICRYGAIAPLPDAVLVLAEMCHGCGGCAMVCPRGAITEVRHVIGHVDSGRADSISFLRGVLNVGQPMSPPVIKAVIDAAPEAGLVIVDAPPGTSCPVIESVGDCDFVILVTEPTPFGLHDLELAVRMVRLLDLPFGVVINRADLGDRRIRSYCRSRAIDVLAEIPSDRRIAEAYSYGELLSRSLPEYDAVFTSVLSGAMRHLN